MTLVLLVPAFLLVAAAIVLVGSDRTSHARAKLAAYPVGLASLGAMGTLYQVASDGPIEIRFYDLASVASFAIPIGFYVDRLSAIMMTLITGVSVI
ncbi:MAG TPA: NADH-quinone oxidoreductase subunit L, partial [Nitrospira sp.]|nr:NADH-quinone oxidoreductase subunit L [Nitrospira sp.]